MDSNNSRTDYISANVDEMQQKINEIMSNSRLSLFAKEVALVNLIHVTHHQNRPGSSSKLDGLDSISTSAKDNAFCAARRNLTGSICQSCFAYSLLNRYAESEKCAACNGLILKHYLISKKAWTVLPILSLYARIESIGDVENVIQARNYIRIIASHRGTKWGIWSKNWSIWKQAFELEGKPSNCTFVFSSTYLNRADEVPEAIKAYTDHVFTVYDRETVKALNVDINCGGRRCAGCLECYKKRGTFQISEQKK